MNVFTLKSCIKIANIDSLINIFHILIGTIAYNNNSKIDS